jgi:hypothetical protein
MGNGAGPALTFREGRARDLPRALAAYRACFGKEACLRTVAHSPLLFLAFYGVEVLRGRCKLSLAESGGRVSGLCMLRRVEGSGDDALWLCTALCVREEARGTGAARRLFEMVEDRKLVGSVESDGPLVMYDRLGWTRTGWQTLVYFDRATLRGLRLLPRPPAGRALALQARALNRRAFLLVADGVDERVLETARRRLRWFRTGVLQLPGKVEVPEDAGFRAVIHEVVFHRERPHATAARRFDGAGRATSAITD